MSRSYAEVIGDPISHSKSPTIHGFWLDKLGIAADYRACHVRPDNLSAYFSAKRADALWRGCNVTIPHKQAVVALLDRSDEKAQAVGAVNTVMRLCDGSFVGTNTDVDGVADAVAGLELAGRTVVVIGAGGAARAAFAYLAERRCASVRVLARDPDKARAAAAECGIAVDAAAFAANSGRFDDAALVINATQLGMTGQDAMPGFVLAELSRTALDAMVFDMVYAPLETALLRAARARGRCAADGLLMLIGQASTAFERFFERPPPRECDAELRALLTA